MFYSTSWTSWISMISLIFITEGTAQCLKPTGKENVVLTNDALLQNDYPEGSEVTFQCSNGYVIEQGSERITCTNRNWSVLELTCKKKDCGYPAEIPHLKYDYKAGGTLFGASIRVFCDKGYYLQGPSYRQCFATGWSGKPKCEVVICEVPNNISNGIISRKPDKEFPEYGDVIQYSCNQGYTLVGNKSSECNEDGEYTSTPECKDTTTTISSSITTLTTMTVPTTKQGIFTGLEGQEDTWESDINDATGNAALVGGVLGTLIVTLVVLIILYRFSKKKGARTAPIC
ncbi:complement decay-accelerating factor isoform X2 [Esox lucius]|uniref:Sushi domain-containing protein n=1 Tax=Esox lucius TaxID=8010 RepID=A0AAY5L1P7_ESOLU|nr:complement decay-accelerating factor isoform X2 [Esox lucius]